MHSSHSKIDAPGVALCLQGSRGRGNLTGEVDGAGVVESCHVVVGGNSHGAHGTSTEDEGRLEKEFISNQISSHEILLR